MAKALTKTVDGTPLSADQFAYVGDANDLDTWHLPIDSRQHINSALDMFAHTDLPSSAKAPTARKIVSKAKENNLDTTDFVKNHLSPSFGESPRPLIEIFRAGDYREKGKGLITREDLDRVVRNYDPTYHEAPITIGHPADDKPAYGWIDSLAVDGDRLLAREKQVDGKFNEARQTGKFKKRSAAFYQDADGRVAGLRHVAYLGAQPPEVKGLADVQFDDHGQKFIEVDFAEDETVLEKTVADQIKAFFAETFGGSAQPKTFAEGDVTRIATEAATAAAAPLQAKVSELETRLAAEATKFAEREKVLAGGEVKQRATAAVTRLKSAGRWVPAFEKMGLGLVFDELASITKMVEFGEGDAKKTITPLETLVLFLEGLPKIVPGGPGIVQFSSGRTGNSSGDPLTDAANVLKEKKGITFAEALRQVSEEQPELTRAPATAGAV